MRRGRLHVLLWQRAREPFAGSWALPGGALSQNNALEQSIRRHLAGRVDVRDLSHLEQLETRSAPGRNPQRRELATAYLGLIRSDLDPTLPGDTAGIRPKALPELAYDHEAIIIAARERLTGLSYSNLGFALAPRTFALTELRVLYSAALGDAITATNLQRILLRRHVLAQVDGVREPCPTGGRPARLYTFTSHALTITDQFATLRPPGTPAPSSRPSA